ncbi:dihydrofolate reductase family protein [Jiangella rhizosphaerae]|uniref:Dihydrofolate reductase n=1 Tax=Jiangella rhizosphaerae TaxID=2293569 RepID=A0A418KQ83_9ACTN|nr:dihydrofolate reductase family protein [Jiangella rhizosphaerae]RIQ21603.1 dihydrofolate reductase [Jiangella rhizosphaerae]
MNTLVLDISISLDGFITAAGQTPDQPLGQGGERLHDWIGTDDGRDVLNDGLGRLGAVITGRSTYDGSVPWWGADGPSGSIRRPVFVVTHKAPEQSPENGVYTFVTGGIEDALAQATAAAGDGVVCVMGGADVARQYLAAGLVDEISLHVVPVLFGDGTPLFDRTGTGHVALETVSVVRTDAATHLLYRVLR